MPKIAISEILEASPLNTGKKEVLPQYERGIVKEISDFLSKKKKFIFAIDGLRRVGKTTASKQILNKVLHQDHRAVRYFSFDRLSYQTPEIFKQVIEYLISDNNDVLICLDEIGKIEDWSGILKGFYDRYNTAFIVTGSASLTIRKGKESLAGRMINYTLEPIGFDEYLELKKIKDEKLNLNLRNPKCLSQFQNELDGFLIKGSYPELAEIDDNTIIRQYIRNSTLDKMIFEDIPDIFNVTYKSKLMNLFEYISNYSGDFFQEKSLAGLIGLNEALTSEYIKYLEESYLVKRIYTEANYEKKYRKNKKFFVASPSIYRNITEKFSEGKLLETAVFDKLRKLNPLTYRNEQKKEVDFIIKAGDYKFAIEVKSASKIPNIDLGNLIYYLDNSKNATGILIYNGDYDEITIKGKKIYFVPIPTFLASELIL